MSSMNARGPRTRLTENLQTELCRLLAVGGVHFSTACRQLGINEKTACEWRQRGEGEHAKPQTPKYIRFAQEVRKAEAQAVTAAVARIKRAATGTFQWTETHTRQEYKGVRQPDGSVQRVLVRETVQQVQKTMPPQWTADAWWLERKHPEEWRQRQTTEIVDSDPAVLEVPPEEDDMRAWMERYRPGGAPEGWTPDAAEAKARAEAAARGNGHGGKGLDGGNGAAR